MRKDEINLKIEKSKMENAQRIENMRKTNELIKKLYQEARLEIAAKQKTKPDEYRRLIKDLIVQVIITILLMSLLGTH